MNDTVTTYTTLWRLVGLINLMRPKQWIKNVFVFAPLIFCGEFLNPIANSNALQAALLFCLASSATYIVNDIHDIKTDRLHPKKSKSRPLASGIVTMHMALALLCVLYVLLVWSLFVTPKMVSAIIAAYMILNTAYTFILKNQPVLDIFTIAIGFVLRVYAGAMALNVSVSSWMFITTLCLALYLATIKRRQELIQSDTKCREVLKDYSFSLINRYAEMSATGALIFYSMFVMTTKPQLSITVPLVLFGLFRYWYVVDTLDGGESPTDTLLADRQLLLTVVLWVSVCIWALWPVQA